jgi:hypothetical protein
MTTPAIPTDSPSKRDGIAIPGGRARLVAELVEPGGGELGDVVLQALEGPDGALLLRIGYRRAGATVRAPATAGGRTWTRLMRRAGADPVIGPLLGAGPPAPAGRHRA